MGTKVNIRGNERADSAAKSALSLPVTNMKLPARELLPCVSNFCLDEWKEMWDCCEGNKLHSVYPTVGILKHSKNMSCYKTAHANRPMGTKVPGNERAREGKFQGTFIPHERKFPGTKGAGNESSLELSFLANESSP